MKSVRLSFTDSQVEELKNRWIEECAPSDVHSRAEELSSNQEALREAVAAQFESKGYQKQADEMRSGRMPLEPYIDELTVKPETSFAEMVGELLAESYPELNIN